MDWQLMGFICGISFSTTQPGRGVDGDWPQNSHIFIYEVILGTT